MWYETKTFSASTIRSYKIAYKRCKPIYDMAIADIRLIHLRKLMDDLDCSSQSRSHVRIILMQVFEYAVRSELVQKNYAKLLDAVQKEDVKQAGVPFSKEEEKVMWANLNPVTSYLLIGIYSGWRVNELLHLTVEDGVMRGGSKTKAGKDRLVPIHSKIQILVDSYEPWSGSYTDFRKEFTKQMEAFGFAHLPKDTRHTFATRCAEAGVDDKARKIMMGHAMPDITEKHYTHRSIEYLKNELEKI